MQTEEDVTEAVSGLQIITDEEVLRSLPYELPTAMEFVSYDQILQGLLDCR
jgi:hypothetical protein